MYIVIDRSKWRTGGEGDYATGKGDTFLLNEGGYMCCLGFACLVAGALESAIEFQVSPADVGSFHNDGCLVKANLVHDSDEPADRGVNLDWVSSAMLDNDNEDCTQEDREAAIVKDFKLAGHTVEFVGEYESYW